MSEIANIGTFVWIAIHVAEVVERILVKSFDRRTYFNLGSISSSEHSESLIYSWKLLGHRHIGLLYFDTYSWFGHPVK